MNTESRFFRAAVASIFFITALSAAHAAEITLNINHSSTITGIHFHPVSDRYITVSRDGTMRNWVPNSLKSSNSFQVTSGSIEKAVLNPSRPEIALLRRAQNGDYSIAAIDIETGSVRYEIDLEDNPLYIAYSPQGSFLAYTLPRWESLVVHNANTGRQLSHLRNVGGIKSFFIFSRSEANIMTYQASNGEITYHDVRRGSELQRSSSISNLDHIQMLGTRFMIGVRAGTLYVIDVVNGNTVDSRSIAAPIINLIVDEDTSTIGVLTSLSNRTRLQEFSLSGNTLISRPETIDTLPATITTGYYHSDNLIIAADDHSLSKHNRYDNTFSNFVAENLQPVHHIALTNQQLHLSTADSIISIFSDVFGRSLADGLTVNTISETISDLPQAGKYGISPLPSNRVLIWPKENSQNLTVYEWSPDSGIYTPTPISLDSPVRELEIHNNRITLLSRQGTIARLSTDTFSESFTFRNVELQTVSTLGQSIIGGKTQSSGFESPLILVDPQTLETVPVDDSSILIFSSVYDNQRDILYTLSLIENRSNIQTVLRLHTGQDPSRSRILSRFNGEDMSAELYLDPSRNRLYTSMGGEHVSYWNGHRMVQMQNPGSTPRFISGTGDLIWARNNDGTVSFWQANNGVYLGNLAVFQNGSWVFISPLDGFISSDDFDTRKGLSMTNIPNAPHYFIERYRVRLPFSF